VLVSVPMDIFSMKVETALFERLAHHTKTLHKPSIDEETAEQIVRTLADAKNPVIQAGGGVILADAAVELREFVDHMGIPVAHSLMGKGVLPDDHPLTLGMTGFWGTKFVNEQCRNADWILGIGTRFAEADCSSWEDEYTFRMPPSRLIHIDIDPSEIGRNYPAEIGVVTDLKQALAVMNRVAARLYPKGVERKGRVDEIAAYRREFQAANVVHERNDAFPMRPERILATVREVLPRDAIITTDVGWNKNGVGQQFPIYTPGSILTPGGYATMGFGAPAAIGAKLACPDRVVCALVGDGGFGQNPAMLATAAEMEVPVVWVVMNNNAYGTIAGLEMAHYGTAFGCVFRRKGEPYHVDFAAIAKAYGIDGTQVKSAAEFGPALKRAVESGKPWVIDVAMQNEPVPTAGHWNINDIYSPGKRVSHVSTD
jgi:acetolactate synthase-1/2/3 large subunit